MGSAIELHMPLRHPGIVLGWSRHTERSIVVPDSLSGLQPRTWVRVQLPCLTARIEAATQWDQSVVGDATGERHGGGLESRDTHGSAHFLKRSRVAQIGEPKVSNKIAGSATTARTCR